jgi:nitrate/nitrite transporter NarK
MKNSHRITTILLVIFCMSFQAVALSGIGLFLPEIRKELGLSFTEGGVLSAVSLFVYAAMQIPGGYLADRFGSRKIFFIGALGSTLFCLTFGFITNYWQGFANQAASGFFRSLIFVPSMAFLASWFSPNRRATAMGLSQAGVFMGQIFIFSVGPALANMADWRLPFIVFGAIGVLFSAAFFLFGKEPPVPVVHQTTKLSEIVNLFRHRLMWVFGIAHFIRLGLFQGITLWLPSLLLDKASLFTDDKSTALVVIGYIMAARAIIITPSNVVGGFVSDKIKSPTFVMGLSMVMMAITTSLLTHINNFILLMVIIAINAFFVQFYTGPLFAMPVDIYGKNMTGIITGVCNLFANLGSVCFVYLLGWIKDVTGSFSSGFYTMAGACIVGLVFSLMLKHMKREAISIEIDTG